MSETAEAPVATLTHKDRCDRCSARAFVNVVLRWSPGMSHDPELYFCCHHFQAFEESLAPYVSLVIDERWQIVEHIRDDKHIN